MKNRHAEIAYKMGYRATDTEVISFTGKSVSVKSDGGYPEFGFRPSVKLVGRRLMIKMAVHKLAAYQKFGEKVFEEGLEIRHMDGNRLNFSQSNLELGTPTQNWFDRPEIQRIKISKSAAKARQVLPEGTIASIKNDRCFGMTYKSIGEKYGISKRQACHFCTYEHKYLLDHNVMVA